MKQIDKLREVQNKLINLNGKDAYLFYEEKVEDRGGLKEVKSSEVAIKGRLANMGEHIPDNIKSIVGEKGEMLYVFAITDDIDVDISPKRKNFLRIDDRLFEIVGKESYEYEGEVWGRSLFVKEIL